MPILLNDKTQTPGVDFQELPRVASYLLVPRHPCACIQLIITKCLLCFGARAEHWENSGGPRGPWHMVRKTEIDVTTVVTSQVLATECHGHV